MSEYLETTLSIPSDNDHFMDVLTGSLGARVNAVNLYDLAQFVEDFVLSDRVLVYPRLYGMLEPNLRSICSQLDTLLFDSQEEIRSYFSNDPRLSADDNDCLIRITVLSERIEKRVSTVLRVGDRENTRLST